MGQIDILKTLYQENCIFARHHEQLRATITNFVIIVSAALIGLVTFDAQLSMKDLPVTLFIMILGGFGSVFSSKHYERIRLHLRRARKYREQLDKIVKDIDLTQLRDEANRENMEQYGKLAVMKLNNFWTALHLFISVIGLTLSILVLSS